MKYAKTFRNTFSDINTTNILVGILTILTVLSGLFLGSNLVSADNDSVVDNINITVPVSCTMSGTGMNTHNANVNNGTYTPNIGTTTLKAFCNDSEGFAIYAAGYTRNEIGGTNSNKLVGTASSNNAVIDSGINTSGDTSNWAMKLSVVSSPTPTYPITIDSAPNMSGGANASFSDYHTVPNRYTKVAHRDSGTDIGQSAEGATLNTTYAAYISKTQPADTYSGQVKYTLVHPSDAEAPLSPQQATAGCINYFANASNAVGTMGCQSATDGNTITLLASNFSRTGYGFAGWSDSYDYATNQNAKFYGPQEDITVPTGTTANGLSLYAVWIPSAGSLQDSSKVSQLCSTGTGSLTTAPTDGTANLSSVSALTDQRDNETYAIAKLADGNCWLIENLRLESTAEHNSDGILAQGYNSSFIGLAAAESANFEDIDTANSLYSIDGSTDKTISGYFESSRFPRYNNWNNQSSSADRPQNPTSNYATNSTTNARMYSYGNYYTWAAAIADTTRYSSGDHGTTSICPNGWRLPIGNETTVSNSFGALSVALGGPEGGGGAQDGYTTPSGTVMSKIFRSYPNNFLYSDAFVSDGFSYDDKNGGYWSSTAWADEDSWWLSLEDDFVGPINYYGNFVGRSIRCTVSAGS